MNNIPEYLSTPLKVSRELEDIRERLMVYNIVSGERLYGCDEWSEPTVRLQEVIEALQEQAYPRVVDVSKMLIAIENAGFQMANYESTVASDAYDPVAAGSRKRDFKNAIAAIQAALGEGK